MPATATPVHQTAVAPGWAHTMRIETAVGHDVLGLLLGDGAHVLTAHAGQDPLRVTPAFPDVAVPPGEWPAAVSGGPTAAALTVLALAIPRPPQQAVRCVSPSKRTRGLAPLRTDDGLPSWAKVGILGSVPRQSNRTDTPVYLACMTGALARPLPGTPVFRIEDGACVGLLVRETAVTTRLSPPLCVVASVEGLLTG